MGKCDNQRKGLACGVESWISSVRYLHVHWVMVTFSRLSHMRTLFLTTIVFSPSETDPCLLAMPFVEKGNDSRIKQGFKNKMIQLRGEEFAYHGWGYGFDHQQGKTQSWLLLSASFLFIWAGQDCFESQVSHTEDDAEHLILQTLLPGCWDYENKYHDCFLHGQRRIPDLSLTFGYVYTHIHMYTHEHV